MQITISRDNDSGDQHIQNRPARDKKQNANSNLGLPGSIEWEHILKPVSHKTIVFLSDRFVDAGTVGRKYRNRSRPRQRDCRGTQKRAEPLVPQAVATGDALPVPAATGTTGGADRLFAIACGGNEATQATHDLYAGGGQPCTPLGDTASPIIPICLTW